MTALEARWQYQDRLATAFDEVSVLDEMGRAGWELTGFGILVLRFRRPEDARQRVVWEHRRVIELAGSSGRAHLEQERWTYCGSWMGTLHYFKRSTGGPTATTGHTGPDTPTA
jgi:hypothetical protein